MLKKGKTRGKLALADKILVNDFEKRAKCTNKLLRKLTALGLCAGLIVSGGALPMGRTHADGAATLPEEYFVTPAALRTLCDNTNIDSETNQPQGLLASGTLASAGGTDRKLHIAFGTRPQAEFYFNTEEIPECSAAAGAMNWLVVGKESDGNVVLHTEDALYGSDDLMGREASTDVATNPISSLFYYDRMSSASPENTHTWDADRGGSGQTVYVNHWGASDLRARLNLLSTNTSWFKAAEQTLMLNTTVTTEDTYNDSTYTTTGKLYCGNLAVDMAWEEELESASEEEQLNFMLTHLGHFTLGASDTIRVHRAHCGSNFWLRSPVRSWGIGSVVMTPLSVGLTASEVDSYYISVSAGFKLDLTNVRFAAAAHYNSAATTGAFRDAETAPNYYLVDEEDPTVITPSTDSDPDAKYPLMYIRLDGSNNSKLSETSLTASDTTVSYSGVGTSDNVRLMAIATNANGDVKQYAQPLTSATGTVNLGEKLTGFQVGQAWLEVDESDGSQLTYATAPVQLTASSGTLVSGITLTKDGQDVTDGAILLDLDETSTATITTTVLPAGASNSHVNWTSSSDSVATVADGTVTAVAPGVATITATAADGSGVAASLTVGVKSGDVFIDNTGGGDGSASDSATSLSNALTSCLGGGTIKVNESTTISSNQTLGNENSAFVIKLQPSSTDPISLISSAAESTSALTLRNVELNSGDSTTTQAVEWNSSGDITLSGKVVATIKLGKTAGDVKIPINGLAEGSEVFMVKEEGNSRILSYKSW